MKSIRQVTTKMTKYGDNSDIFQFQLWQGGADGSRFDDEIFDLKDAIATVQIANESGFVAEKIVKTVPEQGIIEIDMGEGPFVDLPADSYLFQVKIEKNKKISLFPSSGGQGLRVFKSLTETDGELVPSITFDTVLKAVDDKIAEYLATVKKGNKGDKGDTGSQGQIGKTGPQGKTGPVGPKGDKGDKGDTGSVSLINYNSSFPPIDYLNADILKDLPPLETRYYGQTANNKPINVPWSGSGASLAVRMRNNDNDGKEIVYTLTGQTWERITTNLGTSPSIGKWVRTDVGAISEYLAPTSGTFDAEDALAGSKFEYTVSGNQVTINYAYTLRNVNLSDGDVIVGTLPPEIPSPFGATATGFIMNVTNGARFGSLRIEKNRKVIMNWNESWKSGNRDYIEASISYISNTLLPNQLS